MHPSDARPSVRLPRTEALVLCYALGLDALLLRLLHQLLLERCTLRSLGGIEAGLVRPVLVVGAKDVVEVTERRRKVLKNKA